MNNLLIITRSYVRKDGTWDLSMDTIKSMSELLSRDKSDSIRWMIVRSSCLNCKLDVTPEEIEIINSRVTSKVKLLDVSNQLSCSEARIHLYERILFEDRCDWTHFSHWSKRTWKPDFFMNLDSDDEIADIETILSFVNSDEIEDDLIGFGLEFTGGEPFSKEWDFNYEKFIYSRRYVTTETQTMFLFLYRVDIIKKAIESYRNKVGYLRSESVGSPNESCDDTLMALEVAESNKLEPNRFKIGALCANMIRYHIHPGQVSENQQSEYKNKLKETLWDLGYLYVNSGNFYLSKEGRLEKFNPYDIARERNIIK